MIFCIFFFCWVFQHLNILHQKNNRHLVYAQNLIWPKVGSHEATLQRCLKTFTQFHGDGIDAETGISVPQSTFALLRKGDRRLSSLLMSHLTRWAALGHRSLRLHAIPTDLPGKSKGMEWNQKVGWDPSPYVFHEWAAKQSGRDKQSLSKDGSSMPDIISSSSNGWIVWPTVGISQ